MMTEALALAVEVVSAAIPYGVAFCIVRKAVDTFFSIAFGGLRRG